MLRFSKYISEQPVSGAEAAAAARARTSGSEDIDLDVSSPANQARRLQDIRSGRFASTTNLSAVERSLMTPNPRDPQNRRTGNVVIDPTENPTFFNNNPLVNTANLGRSINSQRNRIEGGSEVNVPPMLDPSVLGRPAVSAALGREGRTPTQFAVPQTVGNQGTGFSGVGIRAQNRQAAAARLGQIQTSKGMGIMRTLLGAVASSMQTQDIKARKFGASDRAIGLASAAVNTIGQSKIAQPLGALAGRLGRIQQRVAGAIRPSYGVATPTTPADEAQRQQVLQGAAMNDVRRRQQQAGLYTSVEKEMIQQADTQRIQNRITQDRLATQAGTFETPEQIRARMSGKTTTLSPETIARVGAAATTVGANRIVPN
jgi:hypothetical protein